MRTKQIDPYIAKETWEQEQNRETTALQRVGRIRSVHKLIEKEEC